MRSGCLFVVAASLLTGGAWAGMMRNPPCKLDEGQNSASTCEKCPADGASNGCVHILDYAKNILWLQIELI